MVCFLDNLLGKNLQSKYLSFLFFVDNCNDIDKSQGFRVIKDCVVHLKLLAKTPQNSFDEF